MSNEIEEGTKTEKPSMLGIITNPTEQFERIKKRPIIWGAMGIVIILTIIGLWLNSKGVTVPELEELEMDEDLAEGMEVFNLIGTIFAGIFVPLFGVLLSSFIYWLVAKIAQSEVLFKQLFSMNTYIMIITALGGLLNGIIFFIIGSDTGILVTSLGSIITVDGALSGLFESIEVFSIWTLILTAIGLHKVADFSKGLAWGIAIAFFVLGIIFSMAGAGLSSFVGA